MTWRFTLGLQYAREPHPTLAHAHPDNWIEVEGAPDELSARAVVVQAIGARWSHCYDEDAWAECRHLFPGRCIVTFHFPVERRDPPSEPDPYVRSQPWGSGHEWSATVDSG